MAKHPETTVAVVATRPETVLADYARLLELAGLVEPADVGGERGWQLVPAVPAGRPGPATACPPWQLEGVVRALLAAGQQPGDITLAVPAGTSAEDPSLRQWRRVLAGYDVDDAPVSPTLPSSGASRLLLANLRTHRRLGLLGGVAALAGVIVDDLESADLREAADVLQKNWQRESAALAGAVVDATVAGDGIVGSAPVPVAAHLLLAGRDPVAVDAVACRLAGYAPLTLPLLAPLAAAKLGCADLSAIELVGDTLALPSSLDLVAARRFGGRGGPGGPRWWRRWRTVFGERWPRPLARRRARRRYEDQAWGRLHLEYQRRGIIGGKER